jgi:hypothetical protein
MYSTYNGWKLQGRQVRFGERSGIRNEYGDKMFHINQTQSRDRYIQIETRFISRPVRRIVSYY